MCGGGGGTGIHASQIQKKGFSIELVDIDEAALIKARNNNIICHRLSGLEISSLGEKYDIIYCLDVPLLIGAKFSDFLEEVRKVLSVNGIFIFNFMPKYSYKNIIKKLFPKSENQRPQIITSRHIQELKIYFKRKVSCC